MHTCENTQIHSRMGNQHQVGEYKVQTCILPQIKRNARKRIQLCVFKNTETKTHSKVALHE